MLNPSEITGVVLAGGKSSRFGSNKALSRFEGKSFLHRSVELLKPYTNEVVVAGSYPEYENIGIKVLEDTIVGIGPIGGIYTGLQYCASPWILVVTCDMPMITPEIIENMLQADVNANVIGWGDEFSGGSFPLLISKVVMPIIESNIAAKQYSVKQLFHCNKSLRLPIPEKWKNNFKNINTQNDFHNLF